MSVHLPPPPGPPPPGGPIRAANWRPPDTERPVSALLKPRTSNTFHMNRDPGLAGLLTRLTNDRSRSEPIPEIDLQAIFTALLETRFSDPGDKEPGGAPNRATLLATTIAQFNNKTKAEQFQFLNQLWARCYSAVVPSVTAAAMEDGEAAVHPTQGKLPTCLRPVNRGAEDAVVQAGPKANAWKAYQIGFRIEGGFRKSGGTPAADLTRVMSEGIAPLARSTPLALAVAGKSYLNLDVGQGTQVHLGYQNRDVYNESASCVSRTLLGATAFPYRNTDSAADNCSFRYLFAVSCTGLLGVDTEAWQASQPGVNLWRPGEKAFLGIPKENILAYTPVLRRPLEPGVAWQFQFQNAVWRWINRPSPEIQAYLNEELAAWDRDRWYKVPGGYDFQIK